MRLTSSAVVVLLFACSAALSHAQESVIWSFHGTPNDGAAPTGKVAIDREGNIYGTTQYGGTQDWGIVFELSPGGTWTETLLHSFCQDFDGYQCTDGAQPIGGLITDATGNLYGTTYSGGSGACGFQSGGCGTVFELSPPSVPGGVWTYSVLYNFCSQQNCADGALPMGRLQLDSSGNLYGTGVGGGNGGVVFELSPGMNGWTESVLYDFCQKGKFPICPDGYSPKAGVTLGKDGSLYGTTSGGGSPKFEGGGVVYRLSRGPNGWSETVLDSFSSQSGSKGGDLLGAVNFDPAGNLYSTASGGGKFNLGTVFRLSPLNGGSQATLSFDGSDGAGPVAGVLIDPRNGTLYGTTTGANQNLGTVYKIRGKDLTVLHYFGGSDGAEPKTGLEADRHGNLYGTTEFGGDSNMGVVFQITP